MNFADRGSPAALPDEPQPISQARAFCRAGKTAHAIAELRKASQQSPADWQLHDCLGDLLIDAGRTEEAIGAFIQAFRLNPALAPICVKIGRAFFSRGMIDPALFWLRQAMELDSHDEQGLVSLAVAEAEQGCRERVSSLLDSWIAAEPDSPVRRHLASAILGDSIPPRASQEYVKALFDGYANHFDESLAKLKYCGPQLIASALKELGVWANNEWHVLDVGCGTGLVGEVLRPLAARLVGVDLSENMIRKAADREIYDELDTVEMHSFMNARPREFHLIAAADVLTYCGELRDFAAAAATALRPGGWLVAVLEYAEQSAGTGGYRLNRSGRYAHIPQYVTQCLLDSGFAVRVESRSSMRNELARPIPTLLVAAERV